MTDGALRLVTAARGAIRRAVGPLLAVAVLAAVVLLAPSVAHAQDADAPDSRDAALAVLHDPSVPVPVRCAVLRALCVVPGLDLADDLIRIVERDLASEADLVRTAFDHSPGHIPIAAGVDLIVALLPRDPYATSSRTERLMKLAVTGTRLGPDWRRPYPVRCAVLFAPIAARSPVDAARYYEAVMEWAAGDRVEGPTVRDELLELALEHLPGTDATQHCFAAMLDHDDPQLVARAARRLGDVPHPSRETFEALVIAASGRHWTVREQALPLLARMPTRFAGALAVIRRALDADRPALQYAALRALTHVDPPASVRARCAELLETGRLRVRMRAAEVLARIGGPALDDLARIAATTDNGAARMLAGEALGRAVLGLAHRLAARAVH